MPPWVWRAASAAANPASAARYLAVLASSPQGSFRSSSQAALRIMSSAARRRAWASASGKAMPWFFPIGRSKTTRSLAYRPARPQCLAGDEDPLGVEPVEQVVEPSALLADPVLHRDRKLVVAHLTRRHGVAAQLGDRPDVDLGALEVGQQQRHAVG